MDKNIGMNDARLVSATDSQLRQPGLSRALHRAVQLLTIALAVAAGLSACKIPLSPEELAAEQERARRRAELLTMARDTRLDLITRRDAVRQLLASGHIDARRQLIKEIDTSTDSTVQQAIAQALAGWEPAPHVEFRQPLANMLPRVDPDVPGLLGDVAAALGRYEDDGLTKRMMEVAQDRRQTLGYRRGAALTLGYYRQQQVAKVLIDLTDARQPDALRQAAFDALAVLSGIDAYGADADAWQRWWDANRRLSREQFLARLVDNFARYNTRTTTRDQQQQTRLLDVQRQLYRAASPEERTRVLAQMLGDDLAATRQLAMDLMLQRLIDNEPTPPPLRDALVARLDDPLPVMRQRAALLLREMRDEEAANSITQRLIDGNEPMPAVKQAYLLTLARMPRVEAVEPALEMLHDPELQAEAAAMLTAAADAGMLSPEQADRAATTVRQQLRADTLPRPQVVLLLGRVGNDQDFRRIEGWLDARDPAVKQASAQAWAHSDKPLAPLAQRASDPVIRDIVIEASAGRGNDPQTLFALIDNKPVQEQVIAAWRRALTAMAQRVPARSVIDADRRLMEMNEPATTREPLLTAAIDRFDGEAANNDMIELLLARAEVRLNGDGSGAVADYSRIDASRHPLSPAQRDRYDRGLLRARLATGNVAGAFELARKIIGGNPAPRADTTVADTIVGWFLDTAQRAATTGRPETARSVTAQVRALFSHAISDATARRLADLEATLPAQSSPTTPTATDTTPATGG
jgi:hypothetical protein